MACIDNGMFAKISNHWPAINIGLLKLIHSNDLHPFVNDYYFTVQLYRGASFTVDSLACLYIGIWLEYYGMLKLWDLIFSKLFIKLL